MTNTSLKDQLSFGLLRLAGVFFSKWPLKGLHILANALAPVVFYFSSKTRKRLMSNLSFAKKLPLDTSNKKKLAIASLANLLIVLLEYFQIEKRQDNLSSLILCENPDELKAIKEKHQEIIFVSGHQANWELPFLYFTQFFPMVAVGKETKNPLLYEWVLKIRCLFKGKIIPPKNAVQNCLQAIKDGMSVGLVFDQAYPASNFDYPLLGSKAWTTLGPAIISYRSNRPIVFISVKRVHTHYVMKIHPPIEPDLTLDLATAAKKQMTQVMDLLDFSILQNPSQWLWLHNRWKQVGVNFLPRRFRHDNILIIIPDTLNPYYQSLKFLNELLRIYKHARITLKLPKARSESPFKPYREVNIHYYENHKELYEENWEYQLVFNLTDNKKLSKFYLNLSAFEVLSFQDLLALAKKHPSYLEELNLEQKLSLALSRK